MNREKVRQAEVESHKAQSAAAWAKNGFQEDPGAAALIAKAKAKRVQVSNTAAPSLRDTPVVQSPAPVVPAAPARAKKK